MRKAIMLFFMVGGVLWGSVAAADFNPLRLQVRAIYPAEIATIEQAARYLVEPIGYELTTAPPAPRESAAIAAAPLSPLAKNHRILSIEDALLLLIGEKNRLVVDHPHKLISFDTIK
jgi:type IV pili sensor histidine kinase/response regulator